MQRINYLVLENNPFNLFYANVSKNLQSINYYYHTAEFYYRVHVRFVSTSRLETEFKITYRLVILDLCGVLYN